MSRYLRKFGYWQNLETGERVDNRLLEDELEYFYQQASYLPSIKDEGKISTLSIHGFYTPERFISVTGKHVSISYPFIYAFRIKELMEESLLKIVQALGIPPEYFR